MKKVFVSGCFDLLHSGHVEFFRQASQYGDLYVGIGSDKTILEYKHHKTLYCEQERLFMVKSIRYVKDAYINAGSGIMDFIPTIDFLKPNILIVNEDGSNDQKKQLCEERGIEYIVLKRTPNEGLSARSSTDIKNALYQLPTRIDIAGTWIDQPYVSCYAPGWALTISVEPTFEVRDRCGLSTSTRNVLKKIYPHGIPKNMDPEVLARLVFCMENHPERESGHVSGAQDAIGICVPGLCRHYYDNRFWPEKIDRCSDERVLAWLEAHMCMIPMFPRRPGCSVVENSDISKENVLALTSAAEKCWTSIINMDLEAFSSSFMASFDAQVKMFPGMVNPKEDCAYPCDNDGFLDTIQDYIDMYSAMPGVLAWKLAGAGGGGYLILVCTDKQNFPPGSISISIRRA